MNKISVIIPVFNREKTIERCLKSICNQTVQDLEIIVIDDGSQDATLDIVQQISSKDNRIRVIQNKKNSGAGFSRNRGLEVTNGNYISFIDSDDFLHPETMRHVYDTIKLENRPDLIRFPQSALFFIGDLSFNINFASNNIFNQHCGEIATSEHYAYVALETPGVCNKIWRRDLIGNTTFPPTKWEDYPFSTPLFGKAKRIFFLPNGSYYYCHYISAGNTTLKDVKKKSDCILEIFDCCDLVEQRYRDFDLFYDYESAIRSNQKIHALQRIRDILFSPSYSSQEKKELIPLFVQLIEMKYGKVFSDEYYFRLKKAKCFYRIRMNYIEKLYCSSAPIDSSIDNIKKRIREMIK